jgi:hypothetical protein
VKGFHVLPTIGGAYKLIGPLGESVATFGDATTLFQADSIARALNDVAHVAQAVGYIERHIAAMPCDDVPDELVCALVHLGAIKTEAL